MHQHQTIVNRLMQSMLGPRNRSCAQWSNRTPIRLLAEHHYSRHSLEVILGHFGPFSPLQRVAARCRCRVVLVTRLREPASFYISFYRWTVNWRQQHNSSAYGRDILEWAPRNLQATMVLNPLDATWAEFTGLNTLEGRWRRKIFSQFDDDVPNLPGAARADAPPCPLCREEWRFRLPGPGAGAKRREELRRVLASFDLVGLVERFDETLLMLSDLSGLQRLLYTKRVPETTNPHYTQPSVAEVCPDMARCRDLIAAVAPFDHELYATAASAFDARVKNLGAPFQARLQAFRKARAAYEEFKAPPKDEEDTGYRFQRTPRVVERGVPAATQFHHKVPIRRLKCFLGDGEIGLETCQRVYADTPFRYNWRLTPQECCNRVRHCAVRRMLHKPSPPGCERWLPIVADPMSKVPRRKRERMINRSLPTLCQRECSPARDPELGLAATYRVASAAERATLPLPLLITQAHQRKVVATSRRMVTDHGVQRACNDTPAELVAGKPWLDFEGCMAEGDVRENLFSLNGPCSRNLWMRVNCRRTCGMCDIGLRGLLSLSRPQALKAARAAAVARKSPALAENTHARHTTLATRQA
jgi:hypothetical protein